MDSDTESVMSETPRKHKRGGKAEDPTSETFFERYNYLIGYVVVLVLLVLVFVGGYNFVKRMRKGKKGKPESETAGESWNLKEEVGKLEERQKTLVARSQLRS